MKKKVVMAILVATMVVALGACGNQEGSSNGGVNNSGTSSQVQIGNQEKNNTEEKQDNKKKEDNKVEVSMSALESHAVAPATDFEFSPDGDGLKITKYLGSDTMVVLPEEAEGKKIISISNSVFGLNSSVEAVKISDSVESIAATFMSNKNIKYIICGSSMKTVGDGAFNECALLEEIQLNEGLEKIGSAALGNNPNLKTLYIPESVTQIDGSSFTGMCEGFIVQGKAGTKAEEVANSKGYTFEAVE